MFKLIVMIGLKSIIVHGGKSNFNKFENVIIFPFVWSIITRFSAEMHGKGASFPATWLLRARLPSMFIGRGSNRFTEILAGLRRRGPFSMEIYSLILIKHFGSLGSHSSPRISPTLFEPCFVISRISSSHVKLKSIIPNLAILSVFSKFHHFIILYICWNEEFNLLLEITTYSLKKSYYISSIKFLIKIHRIAWYTVNYLFIPQTGNAWLGTFSIFIP